MVRERSARGLSATEMELANRHAKYIVSQITQHDGILRAPEFRATAVQLVSRALSSVRPSVVEVGVLTALQQIASVDATSILQKGAVTAFAQGRGRR